MSTLENNNLEQYLIATPFLIKPLLLMLFISSVILSTPFLIISGIVLIFSKKYSIKIITLYVYAVIIPTFEYFVYYTVRIKINKPFIKKDKLPPINIIISNHISLTDSLIITTFLQESKSLMKIIYKRSIAFVPFLGQILYLLNFLAIKRTAVEFESIVHEYLKDQLLQQEKTLILIYPEGTRISKDKKEASNAFCKSKNMNTFTNVLCPRYKGFKKILKCLKKVNVKSWIIDVTIRYSDLKFSFFKCIFGHKKVEAFIDYKIISISKIRNLKEYLFSSFREKDRVISYLSNH